MQVELDDRTALVTGAGRGNGRAVAERLAANGVSVAVNDRDREPMAETVERIEDAGGTALGVSADVTDEAEVEAMIAEVAEEIGAVDVLVNNAGVGRGDRFRNKPAVDLFEINLDVNLKGAIHCTKHALDGMLDQGYGKVVNITSIHTKNGIGMSPQYDVAKYALLGLTKTLALELGRDGVRVNAVAPGWADTRMTESFDPETRDEIERLNPLGRFAGPEEIAHAVAWLCSPAADYVNGLELRVDGGQQPIADYVHEGDMSEKH
jgi:3-oxoacyl-[acyl-carrier protein] reductase